MTVRTTLQFGLLVTTFLCGTALHATLGERIEARGASVQKFEKYSVHEFISDDGSKIRQYTNTDGVVFGAAWNGRAIPDLKALLGSHFEAFAQKSQSPAGRRAPLVVKVGDLTVFSGGHQRDFRGQALLFNLIPAGVTHEDIK
jgi:hypothetical protein